jgi:hypothetical protein
MTKKILPNSAKSLINDEIAKVFERLKIRLLSPFYKPSIDLGNIKHDKFLSMPGLYLSAYQDANPDTKPSLDALKGLIKVAENYINVQEQKLKDKALETVEQALQDASIEPDFDYQQELNQALLNVFDQTQNATKQVLETELQRVKTVGLQEGTIDLLERQGITDPTVAFLTRKDEFVCKFCKEFYMLDDGVTPRVYKLSELKGGYLNKKNPSPHLAPMHPNCFLTTDGKVLTEKGWKPLKFVAIGDKVLTHKLQFKKVINTMNWDMTLYRKDFYSVKLNSKDEKAIFVTPDHQFWTDSGLKAIKDIDPTKDHLIKLVQNCVYCNKKTDLQGPKLFCKADCRDNFLANIVDNVDKLESVKYEAEAFKPINLIWHHKEAEPTFLHDITVEDDESFFINGLSTKNCRCLMIAIYPGFGFDSSGKLTYVAQDHDEHKNQNKFRKSISDAEFINHNCDDHRIIKVQ